MRTPLPVATRHLAAKLALSALLAIPGLTFPAAAGETRSRHRPASIFSGGGAGRLATAQRLLRAPRGPDDVVWARRLLNFDAWRGHGPSQEALGSWLARPGQPLADRLEGARWLVRASQAGRPGAAERWVEAVRRLPPLAQRLARAQAAGLRRVARRPAAFASPRAEAGDAQAHVVEALAAAGEPWAQTAMGHRLARQQTTDEAVTWWFRAASQGDRLACANLAQAFATGEGLPRVPLLGFAYWCAAGGVEPAEGLARYPSRETLPADAVARVGPWLADWRTHVEAATVRDLR
jgi:TPR repeat protein